QGRPGLRLRGRPRRPEGDPPLAGHRADHGGATPARSAQTTVDEDAIVGAVAGLPLDGNEEGAIPAFGGYLTRHYAKYYNLISFEFERLFRQKSGEEGGEAATTLLTEAGHVCAFHTYGGIMKSAEWYGLIVPMIKSKEDWIHGMVAVVNALGW